VCVCLSVRLYECVFSCVVDFRPIFCLVWQWTARTTEIMHSTSLLGLCLFWQPATWFIYVQLLHYIAIHVVANKVLYLSLSLSLYRVQTKLTTRITSCSMWMMLLTIVIAARVFASACLYATRCHARTIWNLMWHFLDILPLPLPLKYRRRNI